MSDASGPAPKTASRREEKVAERRHSLLEATLRVIAQKGLIGVTMNSIASEAECSYGVVAFHFKSKEGMILAALEYTAEQYEAYVAKLDASAMGPADRLRHMLQTDFSQTASGRATIGFWLTFWAEAVRVPAYRETCGKLRHFYNDKVASDVAELANLRGLTRNAETIACSLNAMVSGFWIEMLLADEHIAQLQPRYQGYALAYLHQVFPDDF